EPPHRLRTRRGEEDLTGLGKRLGEGREHRGIPLRVEVVEGEEGGGAAPAREDLELGERPGEKKRAVLSRRDTVGHALAVLHEARVVPMRADETAPRATLFVAAPLEGRAEARLDLLDASFRRELAHDLERERAGGSAERGGATCDFLAERVGRGA